MRISDWSSDVCSSDLHRPLRGGAGKHPGAAQVGTGEPLADPAAGLAFHDPDRVRDLHDAGRDVAVAGRLLHDSAVPRHRSRSEEHTSELQSLMRLSYAVFCLKKKNNQTNKTNIIRHN